MVKNVFRFLGKSTTWSLAFSQDGADLQWAVIKNTSEGPLLHAYGRDATPEKAFEKVHGIPKDKCYFASVFPSVPTLCRSLILPKLKSKEVQAALIDTLDQTTSLSMGESCLSYESSQEKDGSWAVVAYITQQKELENHLTAMNHHGIDPEYVIPKAPCLAAFIAHFALSGWQYIIDVGTEETTLVLAFEGRAIESTSLVAGKSVLDSIVTLTSSEEGLLYQLLQHLREITTAYKGRYELPENTPVTVTGHVSSPIVTEAIKEAIGAPLSALHKTEVDIDTSFLQYASVIGGAFLAEPDEKKAEIPNFRRDLFSYSEPLLHWRKPLIALCVFSLLLAFSLISYGNNRATAIARAMNKEWKHITETAHTTPEAVRKAAERDGIFFDQEDASSPVELVHQGDWFLADMEKRSLFPLHPHIPHLSDFLVWLNEQIREAEKADGAEGIYLDNCHYVLSSRPTKAHPKEKYQVRIDLEVTTGSAVSARALHNRFLTQNPFVDPLTDVKWSGNNNKYRASFVLRDKTIYPVRES